LLSTPVALTIPPKALGDCLAPPPAPVPEPASCCCEPIEDSMVKNDYSPAGKSVVEQKKERLNSRTGGDMVAGECIARGRRVAMALR